MLYPLSYERLAFRRFFLPVGVAGETLHELRRKAKSSSQTLSDLRKRPCARVAVQAGQGESSMIRTKFGRV